MKPEKIIERWSDDIAVMSFAIYELQRKYNALLDFVGKETKICALCPQCRAVLREGDGT